MYDNPQTGDTPVLLISQAILILSTKNISLCPKQCCLNSVFINDMPKFLLKNPTANENVVIIPSDINDNPLLIPLTLQGVTSYFPVQAATLSK